MDKKGKKRKLRVKPLITFISIVFVVVFSFFYVRNMTVKRIIINGNSIIKDVQIIETANIQDYPKIYRLNLKEIESNISKIPLLSNVKVKRNIFGQLKINVTEDKVYLYSNYYNKYITSSNDKVEENSIPKLYGIPVLINFTPDTILENLTISLNKVDYDIVKMISEIEYSPYRGVDGTIVDDSRFVLLMNDANTVIIDTYNMNNLNNYARIYASLNLDQTKGILYLDTITDENILFTAYEDVAEDDPVEGVIVDTEGNVETSGGEILDNQVGVIDDVTQIGEDGSELQ